jgi:hypothetical protein
VSGGLGGLGGVCGSCGQPRATHAEGCPASLPVRSSQEAMTQALAQAPKPGKQVARIFTVDEVDEMVAKARRWMSGPEGQAELKQELLESALVMLQVKKKLALTPPTERSGNTVQSKAIMDYMELAESMMRVVAQSEKKGEEVDAG